VSKSYLQFLSSLGKVFSVTDCPNIYTGGLNKTGANGKYAIFYGDSIFQLVFHVINLIVDKESPSESHYTNLYNLRKKIIGNDYVNIVWQESQHQEFDPALIISGAILIYIVVHPVSETHYAVKIRYNKRARFNLSEKVSGYFNEDLLISYQLQKTVYNKIEIESQISSSLNKPNTIQIGFDTNITQRFKEIERLNYRFKNNFYN
jgi:tuberous sclerosis protein 2